MVVRPDMSTLTLGVASLIQGRIVSRSRGVRRLRNCATSII